MTNLKQQIARLEKLQAAAKGGRLRFTTQGIVGLSNHKEDEMVEYLGAISEAMAIIREQQRLIELSKTHLQGYATVDHGAYIMLKGFAAKCDDRDPNSPAQAVLDEFERSGV